MGKGYIFVCLMSTITGKKKGREKIVAKKYPAWDCRAYNITFNALKLNKSFNESHFPVVY
ncbi:MAG: hypothetical protein B6D58_03265 [candidate division Zixibacteria bacterium 4484_95]|nr:MAG: hypothetical protein B6D58_03265 [candidate division Zixibacteria bacterium 4484_95]